MSPAALRVARLNTIAFIADKPSTIVLTPRTRERTTGGGFNWVEGDPRSPQVMRIISATDNVGDSRVAGQNGTQREVTYQLLAAWDAELDEYDHWIDPVTMREWTVTDVKRDLEYERRATVTERGK